MLAEHESSMPMIRLEDEEKPIPYLDNCPTNIFDVNPTFTYYQLASQYSPPNPIDRIIWKYHSEGLTIPEIIRELKQLRSIRRNIPSRWTIGRWIVRMRKEASLSRMLQHGDSIE